MFGVRGHAAFYTCHFISLLALAVRHEFLDELGIRVRHDLGAAMFSDLLVGAFDHAVLFAGLLTPYLAGRRKSKALFHTRLGLQLGHFDPPNVRIVTKNRRSGIPRAMTRSDAPY